MAKNYSSRASTFHAAGRVSHTRQITGLDGPSASATFSPAFRQPHDAEDEDEGDASDNDDVKFKVTEVAGEEGEEDDDGMSELDAESVAPNEEAGDSARSLPRSRDLSHRKTQRRKRGTKSSFGMSGHDTATFVTAPMKSRSRKSFSPPPLSFQTARETPASTRQPTGLEVPPDSTALKPPNEPSQPPSPNGDSPTSAYGSTSASPLLPQPVQARGERQISDKTQEQSSQPKADAPGLVQFNVTDNLAHDDGDAYLKLGEGGRRRSWRRMRQGQHHPGEIVKMEKMLVRIDSTMHDLPPDYDENQSLKIEARLVEKWSEFVVVCRESTNPDQDFILQLYKTRKIPTKEETNVKGQSTHEIPLNHKTAHVNFYSSLDKTLVIWAPYKKGTMIHILRTKSIASAAEWYTFIRQTLGWQRSGALQVNVPDLNITLKLEDPFIELESSMNAAQQAKTDEAVMKTMEAEKAVAGLIIQKCLKMLEDCPEWEDVLKTWMIKEKIGLAWKRYDRLEWVHGANERRMYGTLAMQKTHDLELRPKAHYPTTIRTKKDTMTEPPPVEGFLIRLTSQKGNVRRLGKMYFKRLYFTTHNHYLCYSRPAKALPPPPPRLPSRNDSSVPSANELVENIPLIYSVNPFPEHDGTFEWLKHNAASKARHDNEAYKESERKINTLLNADGYINLAHVLRVQDSKRGNSVADAQIDTGPDVDFHEPVADTTRDDGKTESFDDDRTFELVMTNKLIVRLQAYNEQTKREWMHRLRHLVRYWKLRLADDMTLLKTVRAENLRRLDIDEEMEAYLGQFAEKWEVGRSVSSPELFNMCGISCCRAITMAGTLYRKPRRHSTFLRCGVILCHGRLLTFHGTLRQRSGAEVRHIQHDRLASVDLSNCYVYSGLVTEGDLLYQNQTFDSNHPGHHALPRVFLEDGWTSTDEDTMTCFVIWQPRNKSWFKAKEEIGVGEGGTRNKLRYVSTLGVPGRSIVFKARSRAERDHWVMSIGMEIDRLQGGDDIRVVT